MAVHRLTVTQCRKAGPGRHGDGHGLMLLVKPSGAKSWVQRIMVNGRRRDLGLGSFDFVALAEARELAYQNRKLARAGGDPLAERRATATMPTFAQATEAVIEFHAKGWSPRHASIWRRSMEMHALPRLGTMPVNAVATADVLGVVTPLWHEQPRLARNMRARIESVMDWSIAQGHRPDNPATAAKGALPKQREAVKHHAAMAYADVGPALAVIADAPRISERALRCGS